MSAETDCRRKRHRVATLAGIAFVASSFAVQSCGGATAGGTDSNTHWFEKCRVDSDCGSLQCLCGVCTRPCSDVSACGGIGANAACLPAGSECSSGAPLVCGRCGDGAGLLACVSSRDAATGSSGGTCPASVVENTACDGSIEQCWTPCQNGLRGQYACSDGIWGAGKGLFPCGSDAGASVPETACFANVASGAPCDAAVPLCATTCIGGFESRYYCSGGSWIAGHGLFPCGDAGTTKSP